MGNTARAFSWHIAISPERHTIGLGAPFVGGLARDMGMEMGPDHAGRNAHPHVVIVDVVVAVVDGSVAHISADATTTASGVDTIHGPVTTICDGQIVAHHDEYDTKNVVGRILEVSVGLCLPAASVSRSRIFTAGRVFPNGNLNMVVFTTTRKQHRC